MQSVLKKLHSESNGTNIHVLCHLTMRLLEFRADFLGKVSPKVPNCGVIMEAFTMPADTKCMSYSFFNYV